MKFLLQDGFYATEGDLDKQGGFSVHMHQIGTPELTEAQRSDRLAQMLLDEDKQSWEKIIKEGKYTKPTTVHDALAMLRSAGELAEIFGSDDRRKICVPWAFSMLTSLLIKISTIFKLKPKKMTFFF